MARQATFQKAINEALEQEMERDSSVVVMGEDVAGGTHTEGDSDAWGGPMGVTQGLYTKFGDRVMDTPISESAIIDEALRNLYDGVSAKECSTSLVITARTLIEQEPNYSYAAARLLLDDLRAEGLSFMGVAESATQAEMSTYYPRALKAFI